jgi:5-hydroxyisourate hydrolase
MSRRLVVLTLIAFIVVGVALGAGVARSSKAAEGSVASALTTHVLDTSAGRPVAGIPVRLERAGELLGRGNTDADGRLKLGPERLEPGTYRLIFDVNGYYPQSFYPEVTVTFRVSDPQSHLHLPLMLSPFALTTYRGS